MLELEVQESLLVTILRCSGRIVYGDGANTLVKAVMSKDTPHFLIDLNGVNAIDAAGLGALAALQHWAWDEKRTIVLVNLSKRVREAVETTGLSSVLQISLISESTQPCSKRTQNSSYRGSPAKHGADNSALWQKVRYSSTTFSTSEKNVHHRRGHRSTLSKPDRTTGQGIFLLLKLGQKARLTFSVPQVRFPWPQEDGLG